ncbi:MAG: hypothetical protein HQK94_19040 [Nitrospirae bacterium]|nr:hypothetical protein [Nitrospirota bacterium]
MKSGRFLAIAWGLFLMAMIVLAGDVSAFDINGIKIGGQKTDVAKPDATKTEASAEEKTDTNNQRKFTFTIPSGWEVVSGTPDSDNMIFRKPGTSQHFMYQYTQLGGSFPAEASVKASLKTALEDIKLSKNISAKRRDDVKKIDKKTILYARGWELIDAGKNGPQRIIWQCYDRENFYFNFMASSESNEFDAAKPQLQQIIDSIKFLE